MNHLRRKDALQRLSSLGGGALCASNTSHVDDGNVEDVWVSLGHRASWQRSKSVTSSKQKLMS